MKGVMLLITKAFDPKERNDLRAISNYFEGLWKEFEILSNTQNRQKNLINISCNPNKSNTNRFLEEIALEIYHAVTENKSVMLMGEFNINYPHPLELAQLDIIPTPYDLNVLNTVMQPKQRITVTVKSIDLLEILL